MALMMEESTTTSRTREQAKIEVGKVVIGQDRTVEPSHRRGVHGHVLLKEPPGSAKTLIARAVAHMLGASFKRIQFTPDTTPSELNGVNTIRAGEHVFLPGAVFTTAPRGRDQPDDAPHQAALFEPMQERQVTVDGKAHKLPDPFLVIATRTRTSTRASTRSRRASSTASSSRSTSSTRMRTASSRCSTSRTTGSRRTCSARCGRCSASSASTRRGTSLRRPRSGRSAATSSRSSRTARSPVSSSASAQLAMIHLVSAAKANARLHGRNLVTIEDVREMAPHVLTHRLVVSDELTPLGALQTAMSSVPTPFPPPSGSPEATPAAAGLTAGAAGRIVKVEGLGLAPSRAG